LGFYEKDCARKFSFGTPFETSLQGIESVTAEKNTASQGVHFHPE